MHATLAEGEAVLSFPYDERLRLLLRAIPGRWWDPQERVWRVPLEPEAAEALARLFACVPVQVSETLARALVRRRRRRRRGECVVDRVRPDGAWWLGFATDADPELLGELLRHPGARRAPAIGRAMIPLDAQAAQLVRELGPRFPGLRLSDHARRALAGLHASAAAGLGARDAAGLHPRDATGLHAPAASARAARRAAERQGLRDEAPVAAQSPAPAVLELSEVHPDATFVLAPGHDPGQHAAFAALAGALPWHQHRAAWHEHARLPALRADPFCVPMLDAFLAEHGTWIAPRALEVLQEVREEHARGSGMVALSAATDAPLEILGLGGELKPFQRAAVSYVLAQRRVFLADEQGLGKTIEAVAALEADGAYPAVVVCPASLKLNWLRELERWLPGRSARVLAGTASGRSAQALAGAGPGRSEHVRAGAGSGRGAPGADVTVVNYDILPARLRELQELAPRAVVLDESHYCKNPAAKRTKAAHQLAAAVPREGLVMALTGTPVMNRPPELIAQLRILGRVQDFGSGAQFGRRFRGSDAHLRLHWHLRARCFVRRLKSEVLPQLPAKTRAVVPVELDNAAEYRLAERDLVAWLRSQPLDLRELDAKVAAALRAERLVRLNALKQLAARGKLHAALHWIHDFLSSDERLVVFARHREIQHAVIERFPDALHVLGDDSQRARDAAVQAFQGPDSDRQLIVCSIEVAGQGITLTRSSNVAFLELDWTPAKHDQAEDRCHRIGQQDAVNASYLLAADTIDETIATLLERKRAVLGRFPAALHILGEDTHAARDSSVQAFQGPDGGGNQLIVCSMAVAGQGLTLTRASNVAFLELDWTPAKHDQAEDRCHRIGQQDAVNATYLLAAGTIDETIAALLERKRAVIGAVTDGRPEDEAGVVDAVVRELRGAPYRHLRAVA